MDIKFLTLKKSVINNFKLILGILFIIFISLLPRLWQLTTLPPVIVDEPANLRDVHLLIQLGGFHPNNFHWDYAQSTLFHYPTLILIKLGLNDLYAIRLTSVIISTLSLIPFFFIVRKRTNDLIAFCTTILFSFSYFYLQFSRVGWTNIHTIFLGLLLFWILDEAIYKKHYLLVALAGIISGLLMHTYRAGEIFVLAGLIYIIFSFGNLKQVKQKAISISTYIVLLLVTSGTWIYKILNNWELYNLRTDVVSITKATRPYHGLNETIEIYLYQITTTIKSWILMLPIYGGGIENQRYIPLNNSPVNFSITILFILGLIIAITNLKKYYIWFFILLLGLVFGQIMTINPPNGARGLILLPIIYIFAATAMYYIYTKFEKYNITKYLFLLLTTIIAIYDLYLYFQWMTWIKV